MKASQNCVGSSKLKPVEKREVEKQADQILHRLVRRCAVAFQPPYVSMTIFQPVKPATCVQVRAVTVQAESWLPILEDDFLLRVPDDQLVLDELVHLVQVPRNLLAVD